MYRPFKFAIAAMVILSIAACSGGSDSAANGGDNGGGGGGNNTQLASSIDLTGLKALGLIGKSQINASASIFDRLHNFFGIGTAYAQETLDCVSEAKTLVGIEDDGDKRIISATSADNPNSGFCEILDVGRYLVASATNIYQGEEQCFLVLIQKSTGNLSCFGSADPSQYLLTGVKDNSRLTQNGKYLYLTVKKGLGNERQSEKILRFDLTGSEPVMDEVVEYIGGSYTPIFEYKALNNGDLIIWRMEPSTAPGASKDGYLRLVEYWTLATGNPKQVAEVDYVFMKNPGDDRNYSGCFVEDGLFGATDDDVVVYSGSGIWRVSKPNSPINPISPIKIANPSPTNGRICAGNSWSGYSQTHNQNVYSIWNQTSGDVELVETQPWGSENYATIYNTGNSSGAFSEIFSRIYKNVDYLIVPGMNHGTNDSLYVIPLTGSFTDPVDKQTLFTAGANKKIKSISADATKNTFTVTSIDSQNGETVIDSCEKGVNAVTYSCTEILRESGSSAYANFQAIGI